MKKASISCAIIGALFSHGIQASSVFIPENGDYKYSIHEIVEIFSQNKMDYLIFNKERVYSDQKYKFNKRFNEYRIKDWFKQDRYALQDVFEIDLMGYIESQEASSFNEAKRKQYSRFYFDHLRFQHKKSAPSLKEWGGLTHPPVKKLSYPLDVYDSRFIPLDYSSIESEYFNSDLQVEIDEVSGSELSFNNKLQALADSDSFIAKKKLIKEARNTIFMSSLVFVCDESTKELVELLIEKKKQGLDVRIMVDGMISKLLKHRECLRVMREGNLEVLETKDFFKYRTKSLYHAKTLSVDAQKAIAGGTNMIDADNTSRGVDFKNRDVDLLVEGPMVTDIDSQFLENWEYHLKRIKPTKRRALSTVKNYLAKVQEQLKLEKSQGLRGRKLYPKILSSPETRMKGVCRFIKQAPYKDRHSIGKAYLLLLDKLQKHLVINDPIKSDTFMKSRFQLPLIEYFDSFEMFNLLHNKVQSLAKAGKSIDYITTNINMAGNENVALMNEEIKEQLEGNESWQANWSLFMLGASNRYFGKPHYKNLIKDWVPHRSVNVWTHISFMHSKIFYFDRIVASIGSYNFHHNATDHAYESTSICMDDELNQQLDQILIMDMANSIPLIYSSAE